MRQAFIFNARPIPANRNEELREEDHTRYIAVLIRARMGWGNPQSGRVQHQRPRQFIEHRP